MDNLRVRLGLHQWKKLKLCLEKGEASGPEDSKSHVVARQVDLGSRTGISPLYEDVI